MSQQFKASDLKQARASKIQIEVKEIAQPATAKNTSSQFSADADGDDK
jgi:hypothetical protein